MKFSDFNLHPSVYEGVEAMGFETPTEVQSKVIPMIVEGNDVIACAQTGTGKTAAFLLPLMHHLAEKEANVIKALVLAPTRELVQQIDTQFQGFSYFTGLSSIAIYGGNDSAVWEQQRVAIESGCDVMIASPGRLLSHLNLGYVKLESLEYLILDEADKMLDMGFLEDLEKIISYLPKKRQTLMFSATMPPKIRTLAKNILNEPQELNVAISKPAEGVMQVAYLTNDRQKNPLIIQLLSDKDLDSVIVFSSTKLKVKELVKDLVKAGIKAKAIHSDLNQEERESVMLDYRNRKFPVLVATDILSRGIDVDNIGLVLNYDVPQDAEDYVHRVGRTARAKTEGVAITFINENDMGRFGRIEKLIEQEIMKLPNPEEIGEGPAYNPEIRRNGRHKSGKRKPQGQHKKQGKDSKNTHKKPSGDAGDKKQGHKKKWHGNKRKPKES